MCTTQQLARHGPVRIMTVQSGPMRTLDGIPVQITARLAWSSPLQNAAPAQQDACCPGLDRSPASPDEVSVQALTREVLPTMVRSCSLATLLSDGRGADDHLRQGIAHQVDASGLFVHLARIRAIGIPVSVQAAGDARTLLAMLSCVDRRGVSNLGARKSRGVAAIVGSAC